MPSVMIEITYTGVDRAAGYWGKLVIKARAGHLRIDIHEFKSQLLKKRLFDLLKLLLIDDYKSNWWSALWCKMIHRTIK
jgi:hypothetical protein